MLRKRRGWTIWRIRKAAASVHTAARNSNVLSDDAELTIIEPEAAEAEEVDVYCCCVPKVSEINLLIYELSTDMVSSSNYLITSLGPFSGTYRNIINPPHMMFDE